MSRWPTYISVLGAVFLAFALGRAAFGVASGDAPPRTVVDFVLLSLPGLVLWYVAHWLPASDFDPAMYPRVLAWCVGGVAAMFAFILLRAAHPGVDADFTLGTQAIAVALGSVGGLAIGIREAESITRARELETRNRELRQRERELERQNERLDEFTSIVSHDLRNPLNVAAGRLALARESVDNEHLRSVADAHDRMSELIHDLLTLARQGETVDEFEPVPVEALVEQCWATIDTGTASLDVTADCAVLGDEPRLRQLFENLLRNAVEHGSTSPRSHAREDAMEHGSTNPRSQVQGGAVEHGPTSPPSHAREDAAEHGDGVTVSVGVLEDERGFYVADDGPGIPDDERDRVLDHGYSSTTAGTGFGLAIVDRVSDAHGWTLSVAESEDGGARFEFSDVSFE